jgi:hypothetical protein
MADILEVKEEVKKEEEKFSIGWALSKGYLEDRKVYLKLHARPTAMVQDPKSKMYKMIEGAQVVMQLPSVPYEKGGRGQLVNPFKNEEEQKFFEHIFKDDLNTHIEMLTEDKRTVSFWSRFKVKFEATQFIKDNGYEMDLSNPRQNLEYKVAKLQAFTCPQGMAPMTHHKFMLVDADYENNLMLEDVDKDFTISAFIASIVNSEKKMREFIALYLLDSKSNKQIPQDATESYFKLEIAKLLKDKTAKELIFNLVKDKEEYANKLLLYKAIKTGIIYKTSTGMFKYEGTDATYTYKQIYEHLVKLRDDRGDEYLKIEALIKQNYK